MSDFEKDVPIEELRHKYLRKYPLETSSDVSQATPGFDSYYTRQKRTPARLACDIVIFVTFIFFILLVTSSFATHYNTYGSSSYGILAFIFHTISEVESISDALSYAQSYPEIYIPELISNLVLCITAIEIAITTLVCFIVAIVHFSTRNSLKLINIVTRYFGSIVGSYMVICIFGGASYSLKDSLYLGYKISGATTFGLVLLTLVLIGSSVALFISKRRLESVNKKLWIANITFASLGALILAILGSSKLGNVVYIGFDFLYNTGNYYFDDNEITKLVMVLICVAFSVCFSTLSSALKNSFRHMLSLDEKEALPKVMEFSPLKDSIVMTVSIFLTTVITATIFNSDLFTIMPYDILVQGVFVLFFSVALIVVSAIFRNKRSVSYCDEPAEEAYNNTVKLTTAQKPVTNETAPKTVAKPVAKPIPKPVPNPTPKPVSEKGAMATQPTPKPIPKPVAKPVIKPATKENAESPTQKPTQKVVIKIPKSTNK
ncbi:MAG: hypothetical protein IJ437_06950 [Clostridia bacterium]|nr:hypothetical protein [Clostridia bacterium]